MGALSDPVLVKRKWSALGAASQSTGDREGGDRSSTSSTSTISKTSETCSGCCDAASGGHGRIVDIATNAWAISVII